MQIFKTITNEENSESVSTKWLIPTDVAIYILMYFKRKLSNVFYRQTCKHSEKSSFHPTFLSGFFPRVKRLLIVCAFVFLKKFVIFKMSKDCSTQTDDTSRSDGDIFSSGSSTQNVGSDGDIFSSTPRAQNVINTGGIFSRGKNYYIPKDRSIDILFKNTIKRGINFARFERITIRVSGDDVPKYVLSLRRIGKN